MAQNQNSTAVLPRTTAVGYPTTINGHLNAPAACVDKLNSVEKDKIFLVEIYPDDKANLVEK